MSTPTQAGQTTTSISAIRGLLERNLLDRAVAVSEARWPGSGPLVQLAHEWARLSPAQRRQRLAAIGPEDLGRMRAVAQLQPDLARVLDDLEARGIIPPAPESVADVAAEPLTREEAIVDAVLDLAQEKATAAAQQLEPEIAPIAAVAATGAALTAREFTGRQISQPFEPLPQVAMPQLDLGLPSTSDFLDAESARRATMAEQAESLLDRIRERVDRASDALLSERVTPPPVFATPPPPPVLTPVPPPTPPASVTPATQPDAPVAAPQVQGAAVDRWTALVRAMPVVEAHGDLPSPSSAELSAVAASLGLPLVELDASADRRAFYGGLMRRGRDVAPVAGQFPTAVSAPNLVAVRGRLYPKVLERLRSGFCDIPGTQATVRVDPACRIVVLPNGA